MKMKDLAKIERPSLPRSDAKHLLRGEKLIAKRLEKTCVVCGRKIKVILYKDKTYRGGHYFGELIKKAEYWECPKCYWR